MARKIKLDSVSLFSHELKTPLSSLKIAVDLLKKDSTQKDILELMEEELNRMISFIQNHLDQTILKQKELYRLEWKSWDKMIERVVSSLKLILEKNQVHLKVNSHSCSGLEVFMDSIWIEQLLKNLIVNAIKESPKKGTLSLDYKINKEGGLEVSVRDEGKGFFSNQKSTQSFSGLTNTGLGLIISQNIAKAHGGEIKIKSNQGGFLFFVLQRVRKLKKSA